MTSGIGAALWMLWHPALRQKLQGRASSFFIRHHLTLCLCGITSWPSLLPPYLQWLNTGGQNSLRTRLVHWATLMSNIWKLGDGQTILELG